MSGLSPNFKIFLLALIAGIVLILSGCGYRVVKEAPPVLLQTPPTSYLLSEESSEVTAAQLVLDCSATTAQVGALIEWAK